VEQDRERGVQRPARNPNWTTIVLIAGLLLVVLLVAYFATNRNSDQDKLTNAQVSTAAPSSREKLCSSNSTYDAIKRELFRRAAQMRGSDQAAYVQLAAVAVVRMENPVMESENSSSSAVNCSGSLSVDLPPGVASVGGRRTLASDIDYMVEASGGVVLHNADAIIAPLATLARVAQPAAPAETNEVAPGGPEADVAASQSANEQPGPQTSFPGRPSFDCSRARSRGELAVCADSGLSALDLNMATQYGRALPTASPDQRDLLRDTARRFYAFRDNCPDRQCIANAYVGRMREIRDIMEGRWQPPR
jgi:uncharacterized protein YecT (DUF1311 family)